MSESTQDMLTKQVDGTAETIREYARQIESGEYGQTWIVTDEDGEEHEIVGATDEAMAIDLAYNLQSVRGESAEHVQADEPTISDGYGNHSSIDEWPLAVVVKIGQPLAVQITVGGPHVEIAQDLSDGRAKLAGYWGGEKVYRHGSEFQTVLDYFVDSLYEEAPEEYK